MLAASQCLGVFMFFVVVDNIVVLAVVVAQWGVRLHDRVAAVTGNCDVGSEGRVPGASVGAAICASFCRAEIHARKQQVSTCAKPSVR